MYFVKYRTIITVGYNSPVLYAVHFFPVGTFNICIVRGVKKRYDGNGARVCFEVQVVSSDLVGKVWQVRCKKPYLMFLQRSAHWTGHLRHGGWNLGVPLWSPAINPPSHRQNTQGTLQQGTPKVRLWNPDFVWHEVRGKTAGTWRNADIFRWSRIRRLRF